MLVFDKNTEELYILGVFKGQLKAPQEWTAYLATLFAPALKYMQDFLFPNHFTGRLRLVNRDADIQPVEVDEIMDSLFVHPGEDDNDENENIAV